MRLQMKKTSLSDVPAHIDYLTERADRLYAAGPHFRTHCKCKEWTRCACECREKCWINAFDLARGIQTSLF